MRLTTLDQLSPDQQDSALSYHIEATFLSPEPPSRIGIAVSGGGDSMALLHATWRYCGVGKIPIEVVTVNHGLRDAAADEAAMVADFCEKLGIPHTTLHWDGSVATGNIAAAGRNARYRLIGEWALERDVDLVFLGHTLDDVAESFLMRLAREAGVDGLARMARSFEREGVAWDRPLLFAGREMLRDYLRRHDVPWVDDPTNEDENYERVKARKVLSDLAPLGIRADTLSRVAALQGNAKAALEHFTRQEAKRLVTQECGDILIKHRVYPSQLHEYEIERRLISEALKYVGGSVHPPRAAAMVELKIGLDQAGKHTLAGCVLTKAKGKVRVAREYNAVKSVSCATNEIWDNRWAIDGPHAPNLTIRALGESLKDVPDWRETGLPRASLMASPAVFDGETLISAPVAGLQNGFSARIVADFMSFLLSR